MAGNSPDMNPIESLWDVLRDKFHKVFITNKTQLIERLIRVWFHSQKIKALFVLLINGMPRRVAGLKQAKVGQTKYRVGQKLKGNTKKIHFWYCPLTSGPPCIKQRVFFYFS